METTEDIIKRTLLGDKWYFPQEVPPVFVSRGFAEHCHEWKLPEKIPWTWPEQYSHARYGLRRREMWIPNPQNQLAVADVLARNWEDIRRHLDASSISESKCKINCEGEIPPKNELMTPHSVLPEKRLLAVAGHSHILKTDISRFFPSVYTHSIAWALRDSHNKDCGGKLDIALRSGNHGQSIGIPIGPQSSFIIAEIIMAAIDKQMEGKNCQLQGYRHVDDYFLCFGSRSEAELALSEICAATAKYRLAINDAKTEIISNSDHGEELWPNQLRTMHIRTEEGEHAYAFPFEKAEIEKKWLLQFASLAFSLATKHDESVMKCALGVMGHLTIEDAHLHRDNWDLYESILIRIITCYPYTMNIVAGILRECNKKVYALNKVKLSSAVSELIRRCAPLEHHSEVAWALWLAKVVGLNIEDEAAKCLPKVNSSVCALLALDNMENERIKLTKDETAPWRKRLSDKGLQSRFWLLAYEAPDWLGDKSYIDDDEFFYQLKEREVRFYDKGKDDTEFFDIFY